MCTDLPTLHNISQIFIEITQQLENEKNLACIDKEKTKFQPHQAARSIEDKVESIKVTVDNRTGGIAIIIMCQQKCSIHAYARERQIWH